MIVHRPLSWRITLRLRYDNDMSTPNTPVIQGTVVSSAVEPDAVLDPVSVHGHNLGLILRKLISHSPGFHNEADVLGAHKTVDDFIRFLTPQKDRKFVKQESDPAPVEDVTKRPTPAGGPAQPVVPVNMPQIDYNALAAALIAAQQAQAGNSEGAGE